MSQFVKLRHVRFDQEFVSADGTLWSLVRFAAIRDEQFVQIKDRDGNTEWVELDTEVEIAQKEGAA